LTGAWCCPPTSSSVKSGNSTAIPLLPLWDTVLLLQGTYKNQNQPFRNVVCRSVTLCLISFLQLELRAPLGLHLTATSTKVSLSGHSYTLFPLQQPTICAEAWCSHCMWMNTLGTAERLLQSTYFPNICVTVPLTRCQTNCPSC
jgi:hypothetical protein